jgi:hypothetical protein
MRLLVCGDRNWIDRAAINAELSFMHSEAPISLLIHGDCSGADRMAGEWAVANSVDVRARPAEWKLGRRAGPMRNARMLAQEKPDRVIAFHDDLPASTGTLDMMRKAQDKGVPVTLWTHAHGARSWKLRIQLNAFGASLELGA